MTKRSKIVNSLIVAASLFVLQQNSHSDFFTQSVFAETAHPVSTSNKSVVTNSSKNLPNGFYLIQREAKSERKLEPLGSAEVLLINDYSFLSPEERGETSYVVVNKTDYIPMILSESPHKDQDEKGRPRLSISLAEDQVVPLENFTRANVMKSVAIVIGGKVVTMHKIRVPIVGGKMQITRCTDHGCEALYTEIQKH